MRIKTGLKEFRSLKFVDFNRDFSILYEGTVTMGTIPTHRVEKDLKELGYQVLEITAESDCHRCIVTHKGPQACLYVPTCCEAGYSSWLGGADRPNQIERFREHLEKTYASKEFSCNASFDEMLCYELHSQPVNPRMDCKTSNDGFCTGLTFRELAQKWGITVAFLGELIADHCRKLEEDSRGRRWNDAKAKQFPGARSSR